MGKFTIQNMQSVNQQNIGDYNTITYNEGKESIKEVKELISSLKLNIDKIINDDLGREKIQNEIKSIENEVNSVNPNKSKIKEILGQILIGITSGCIANNMPEMITKISNIINRIVC